MSIARVDSIGMTHSIQRSEL